MRFFERQDEARRQTWRLLFLFSLAVAATVIGVHLALAALWWLVPLHLPYPQYFFPVNLGVTLMLVLGGWWVETSNLSQPGSAEKLARRAGAREARPSSSHAEQRLCNIVQEVCIAANMTVPQLMVLPRMSAINAFAAGWDEDDSIVAVSQGAIDKLTREELQGMVAHECSHIHEGDTRLNMQLAGMVFGLELVWQFGRDLKENGGIAGVIGLPIEAMGWFGKLAGRWLQAAVSRQREFLADARAVQWTRSRDGLGGVLRKALTQRVALAQPDDDGPPMQSSLHHLLLVAERPTRGGAFDSHPPLGERIRRLYGRAMPALPLPAGQPFNDYEPGA